MLPWGTADGWGFKGGWLITHPSSSRGRWYVTLHPGTSAMCWVPQRPASSWAGQGNRAGALGNAIGIRMQSATKNSRCWLGWRAFPLLPGAGRRSATKLEVSGWALQGLILAFTYTVYSFLTQNVWAVNSDGLADTTNHPANITHATRGTQPSSAGPAAEFIKQPNGSQKTRV